MDDIIGGILGWVGTVGTLSAYVLLWRGWVSSDALHYSLLNTVGGLLAGAGAFAYGAWPAMVSNALWALIGLNGVISALRRRWVKPSVTETSIFDALTGPISTFTSSIPVAQLAPVASAPAVADMPATLPLATAVFEAPAEPAPAPALVSAHEPIPLEPALHDGVAHEIAAHEVAGWTPAHTYASSIELPWLERQPAA